MIKALSWLFFDDDDQQGYQGELVSDAKRKEEPRRPAENINATGEGPTPSSRAEKPRPIRWGVVGTGSMALEMSKCLRNYPNCELVAVAPWNTQEALPSVWKDIKVYSLMLDLLRNADVDIVYIATPAVLHTNHCMLALQQGRHVVCEPPLSLVEIEAQELLEVARQKKLFLMEAVPLRFAPAIRKVQELVTAGAIGAAKLVHAECGRTTTPPPTPRQACHRSGPPDQWCDDGALIPMGMHALSLVSLVYGGTEPSQIGAVGEIAEDGRIDTQVSLALQHGPGQLGSVCCSTFHDLSGEARIYGSRGSILIPRPFWCPERLILSTLGSDGCTKNEFYHFPAPLPSPSSAQGPPAAGQGQLRRSSSSSDSSPQQQQHQDLSLRSQASPRAGQSPHSSPGGVSRALEGLSGRELTRKLSSGSSGGSPLYVEVPQNGLPEPENGGGSEPITPVMGPTGSVPPGLPMMERGGGGGGSGKDLGERSPRASAESTSPGPEDGRGRRGGEAQHPKGSDMSLEMEVDDINTYGMQFLVMEVHRCLREGVLQSPWAPHAESVHTLRSLMRVRAALGLPNRPREVIVNRIPSLSDWGKLVVDSPPTSPQRPMPPAGLRPAALR